MAKEWSNSALSQDVLGCTKIFPLAFTLGELFEPQEISWLSGMYNPIHHVRVHCQFSKEGANMQNAWGESAACHAVQVCSSL